MFEEFRFPHLPPLDSPSLFNLHADSAFSGWRVTFILASLCWLVTSDMFAILFLLEIFRGVFNISTCSFSRILRLLLWLPFFFRDANRSVPFLVRPFDREPQINQPTLPFMKLTVRSPFPPYGPLFPSPFDVRQRIDPHTSSFLPQRSWPIVIKQFDYVAGGFMFFCCLQLAAITAFVGVPPPFPNLPIFN